MTPTGRPVPPHFALSGPKFCRKNKNYGSAWLFSMISRLGNIFYSPGELKRPRLWPQIEELTLKRPFVRNCHHFSGNMGVIFTQFPHPKASMCGPLGSFSDHPRAPKTHFQPSGPDLGPIWESRFFDPVRPLLTPSTPHFALSGPKF